MNWTGGDEAARMMIVGNPQLPSGQVSFAGSTPLVQAPGANANGTPGNQLLNESVVRDSVPVQLDPGPDAAAGHRTIARRASATPARAASSRFPARACSTRT